MIQIRKSVFETNSSSVHTIGISKEDYGTLPDTVHFELGEYGWENDYPCREDYLFTAIYHLYYDSDKDYMHECLNHIKSVLKQHGVETIFHVSKKISKESYHYYIDHGYEVKPFVDAVMVDDELLMRYLFSKDSFVHTGNDNSDNCPNEDEEFIHEWDENDNYIERPNPYHHPDKFDYFCKEN